MAITIVPYEAALEPAVAAFNRRLAAAGSRQAFPESHVPHWLPPTPGSTLFLEYYVAIEDGATVRGCYGLKHQDYWIGQEKKSVGFLALPISEGIVDRSYAATGAQLLFHAIRNKPLLYALGLGGEQEAITNLVRAAGWPVSAVPFYFRVMRPYRFLRNIEILRRTPFRRAVLDVLAFSGFGWLAGKLANFANRFRRPVQFYSCGEAAGVTWELVDEFGDWADRVWDLCAPLYPYLAIRDAATLQALYPKENPRFLRLRVSQGGMVIGWAVLLSTDLANHKQFGNMRLGSIVDVLAAPADAEKVIAAADRSLGEQKVDLIVSNQCHARWRAALRRCGYLTGPSNFLLATSRNLTQSLAALHVSNEQLHLNRGDGDGPINL